MELNYIAGIICLHDFSFRKKYLEIYKVEQTTILS